MKEQIVRFLKDEDGATAIEYGLIAGLIAVVIIATLAAIGTDLKGIFGGISKGLKQANTESTAATGAGS